MTRPRTFRSEERAALLAFWQFYEPRSAAVSEEVRRAERELPSDIISWLGPELITEQERQSRALMRDAIVDDRWDEYVASLRRQGEQYAFSRLAHAAWTTRAASFRDAVLAQVMDLLRDHANERVAKVKQIVDGLQKILDLAAEHILDGYLSATQQMVARGEERYRLIFERSPLPMWMFDRETLRFVAVNDAASRHYGYSREEFAAMTLRDIRPEEDVDALIEDVQHHSDSSSVGTWRHRKKDGTIITVEVSAADYVLDGREVRLVLANDVTERERAREALHATEEKLRHAQKMEAIGRLAGGVAHDFNNILTVVETYGTLLEESLDAADTRRDDAIEVRRAAERGTAITRQLLAMSRHSIVSLRSVELDEVVAGFTSMLRRIIGERVALVVHRGDVPGVLADIGQLEQVLLNLAVNARDAMPEGGRLTIETSTFANDDESDPRGLRPGRYAVLSVTDTGSGMDAETQRRIFDPFFTTKGPTRGTGLGLSIVHGIVTQAGGAITVYSEPGHGTSLRIFLPIATDMVLPPPSVVHEAPRTLPSVTVLVVDDDRDVREVAARVLRDAGCKVVEAASAEEARRTCVGHDGPIDVMLIDVVLSDGRGDELAPELRELRPSMVPILVSGYPAGALTEHGAAPPDLLPKPYNPAALRGAVERALGTRTPEVAPSGTVPGVSRHKRPAVLVAEDETTLRVALTRFLQAAGCDVVAVDNGLTAMGELEKTRFDVIVSDVYMPGGAGLDLLRGVRRVDLDVPVILMSGTPDVSSAARAVEYGAFRYLTKPFDLDALAKLVHHAARAHALARLRREAFSLRGTHAGAVDRAGLEVRFDQALDALWLAYQPIVDARTGTLFGVEALVRSDEPSMPGPLQLIDAATQLGQLPRLGRRVRALAAETISKRADSILLFVNLHPEDLVDIDLVDIASPITAIASRVVLEVTERASLTTSPSLASRLARLRELGFRIAVDDIGAGYSGLTSFAELTPEIVKIDMSLVRDVHLSALKQRTIGALCGLCHDVGALVVGEGVETLDERACLAELGCDLLQGYLIARPARQLP